MKQSPSTKEATLGLILTAAVLGSSLALNWLLNLVNSWVYIIYALLIVLSLAAFMAVVVYAATKSTAVGLGRLAREVENAIGSVSALRKLTGEGSIITMDELIRREQGQPVVWVVVRDPHVYNADTKLFEVVKRNLQRGSTYRYYVSREAQSGIKWFLSQLTGVEVKEDDPAPDSAVVGNGVVRFTLLDPRAYDLLFAPLVVLNPYPNAKAKREGFWDFPQLPPGYHFAMPDDRVHEIVSKLDKLSSPKP